MGPPTFACKLSQEMSNNFVHSSMDFTRSREGIRLVLFHYLQRVELVSHRKVSGLRGVCVVFRKLGCFETVYSRCCGGDYF